MRIKTTFWQIILTAIVVWLSGFFIFTNTLPTKAELVKTDAVVVLTGGSLRVAEGFKLLQEKLADRLFISGVGNDVKLNELLKLYNQPYDMKNVEIGKKANNTIGNALETKAWSESNNISTIQLVTSNYHMPRSMLEFKRIMPNIKIFPHPVTPLNLKKSNWWLDLELDIKLFSEYNRYLFTKLSSYFR